MSQFRQPVVCMRGGPKTGGRFCTDLDWRLGGVRMSIVFRADSQGNEHQIWAQRQANSCAVAAIWMARSKAYQMSFEEGEWDLAWRVYQHTVRGITWSESSSAGAPTGPMSIDPRSFDADQTTFYNMFGSAGTFARQVAKAMRSDGLSANHVTNTGTALKLNLSWLGESTPAIVLVGWYSMVNNQPQRNGGHFIVAARRIGSTIVFLDPWGGVLNEVPNNARYGNNGLIEEIIYLSA